jgi:hypothetical protein
MPSRRPFCEPFSPERYITLQAGKTEPIKKHILLLLFLYSKAIL